MKNNKIPWTENDLNFLIENYANYSVEYIANILNRSKSSVTNKVFRLKLEKSKEFKQMYMSIKNKKAGRDITEELTRKNALLYNSRAEFQREDVSCYIYARNNGILDEVCSHMISISFSIPQLMMKKILDTVLNIKCTYNNRKIIKPYELDLYYEKLKLAFEYNGKGWHEQNKNDEIKKKLCIDKGIILIVIKENSRRYEEDIKKQICNNISSLNFLLQTKITIEEINSVDVSDVLQTVYNKNTILDLAKSYNSFKMFKTEHYPAYKKLLKLKLIKEATSHMSDKRIYHTVDSIAQTISKYEYLSDFIQIDFGAYLYVKRHKLNHLVSHLKRKVRY